VAQAQPSPGYELMCGRNVSHLGIYNRQHAHFAIW
jgi:hypothetical protein